MESINKLTLRGVVKETPILREFQPGRFLATLTITVTREWLNASKKTVSLTEDFPLGCFGKLADTCKTLEAGTELTVEGRLKLRTYKSKTGIDIPSIDIIALLFKDIVAPTPQEADSRDAEEDIEEINIPF